MVSAFFYRCTRLLLLCLAAAIGYMIVYVPLMNLLFDKRNPLIPLVFLLIQAVAIWIAWRLAKEADRRLP